MRIQKGNGKMKKITSLLTACILLLLALIPSLTGCMQVSEATDVTPTEDFTFDSQASDNTAKNESGLSMATIFADGMVLQRDEPIHIYGYANDGQLVTVNLSGNMTSTVAEDGEWSVTLPAMSATKGLTLEVCSGEDKLVFESVDVGEVFVVSGQSNAQYMVYQLEDWDEISRLVDTYDNIRIFAEQSLWEILPSEYGHGKWIKATKANLEYHGPVSGNVSAVGYVMAMKLAAELGPDVTVAIINACRSGTKITAWLPPEELYKDPTVHADDIARYEDYLSFWQTNGRWPSSTAESKYYRAGSPYQYIPTLCYNSMIAPIKGYTARAVIWYQGESDTSPALADVYNGKFAALKEIYSQAFANDDIPFFVVQIAPYNSDVPTLAHFESVQYDLSLNFTNTYVISTGVDGTPFNALDMLYGTPPEVIHPSRKSPLGYRTADKVLIEIFGRDDITAAPELLSVEKGDGTVTLTFDSKLCLFRGIEAEDFEVYDAASSSWKRVKATLVDNKIVLDTSLVTTPTEVRYGFGGRFIELYTGELIRLNAGSRLTMEVDANGKRYIVYTDTDVSPTRVFTFYSEDGQVIRTIKSGNVTNASGEPLPTFSVSIDND